MRIFLILLLVVGICTGATFYVSPNGSNSNAGTISAPWQTIQYAVDNIAAGDEVIALAGNYSEVVTVRNQVEVRSTGAVLRGRFNIQSSNVTIDGFEITDNGAATAITSSSGANDVKIYNNRIHDLGLYARYIDLPRSTSMPSGPYRWHIKGNHFYGETNANLYLIFGGVGHLIEENEIGPGVIREDAFRPFGDDHVIRNNYIHDIVSGGGHTDIFQIFNDNGWRIRNLIFERNYVNGWNGQAWMADVTPDSYGITVRNNVFINVRSAGNSYCPETRVYNNTFVNSGYGNCQAIRMRATDGRGNATNSHVKNNIFYNTGCDDNDGWYAVDAGARDGFEGDYNLVYPQKDGFNEPNGINGLDPLFINGYYLSEGSPAIGAGTVISGFSNDKDGSYRTIPWDIGAYEYNGGIIPPQVPPRNLQIQ